MGAKRAPCEVLWGDPVRATLRLEYSQGTAQVRRAVQDRLGLRVLTGDSAGTHSTHGVLRRYVGPFAIVWDALETALALVIIVGEYSEYPV